MIHLESLMQDNSEIMKQTRILMFHILMEMIGFLTI